MSNKLSEWELLVVGRQLFWNGDNYYTNTEHCEFLNRFSKQFSQTTYISFSTFEHSPENREDISQLQSDIRVRSNFVFQETDNHIHRIRSLRDDVELIRSTPSNTVSYAFYPGVYSFLLAPFVLSSTNLKISYFGNESRNAAKATSIRRPLGITKRISYPLFQWSVIQQTDIALVRDPRLKRYEPKTQIVFSAPVTSFEPLCSENHSKQLNSPINLLTVAKARPAKGYRYLIKALAKLRAAETRFRSIFVGKGVETYRTTSKNYGVEDMINFVGHINDQNELAKYYDKADIFILPSISEGFPRVLTESMSMQLPVVATKVGGIPHILDDNDTAVLVNPKDADALADGIMRLVNNESLREEIIKNAYAWGQEQINMDPIQQQVEVIRDRIS